MAGKNCNYKIDPLKLVREGTSQNERTFQALDPAYAPVDERTPAHSMVFAQSLAAFLHYFQLNNTIIGTWQPLFAQDVSVLLATAAVQNVDAYRQQIKEYLDFLNNLDNESNETELKDHLGYLFSSIATLADQFDCLTQALPEAFTIKKTLQNLIQTQLAPAFKKIMLYYRDGIDKPQPADFYLNEEALPLGFQIFGKPVEKFKDIIARGLSTNWIIADSASDWNAYLGNLNDFTKYPHTGIYGTGTTLFKQINHIATHNLFTANFDQFLKAYARIVQDAKAGLETTFTNYDQHQPHYALFLAFLRLMEHARGEMNTLTSRHLDFYYKEILRLKQKPAEPGHAHLLVTLAKHATTHELRQNELFNAGKDDLGKDVFFANDRDFVANQAKVAALKTVYRHKKESNESENWRNDRFFASPFANSADGLGEKLTSIDQSWHPFFNKIYSDGKLQEIKMPMAEIGFAVASHYLWMAEGSRTLTLDITVNNQTGGINVDKKDSIECRLTAEDGWLVKSPSIFRLTSSNNLRLEITLTGGDGAITPYLAKVHGYGFDTNLPLLFVKLKNEIDKPYAYPFFQDITITNINLTVDVVGLKTLAVSNDFGPVDTSKPFQPFGAQPLASSSLVIGSTEVFQKKLTTAGILITWQNTPKPYGKTVYVDTDYLQAGKWEVSGIGSKGISEGISPITFLLNKGLEKPVIDKPDFSEITLYSTNSKYGYVRLKLSDDFGRENFENDLIQYIKRVTDSNATNDGTKPVPPIGPWISQLTFNYSAQQTLALNTNSLVGQAKFFHLAPFGVAEEHPSLNGKKEIFLFPQFKHAASSHEAEFYIGITGLTPPQNLALLFQVVDGTADPLSAKPVPHLHWSYLKHNEWEVFTKDQVEDQTGELTRSGIVTLAIPRNANKNHSLLPGGMHWIRIAVEKESDTVCQLQLVAAQALLATFHNQKNDPNFPAKVLPAGAINKLEQPDADVKSMEQPFATFGGRGQEAPAVFYTRVSERLRHKDRSIALWDYERLVLEAFPQLYKAKCLNHTQYEPNESGNGVYRELAAGHVTLVTIPNQQFHNLKDPLKPYTSLGLLLEIEAYLKKRLSCFVNLHVKNPQFEEVKTEFSVRFFTGYDESFYTQKLKQEITRFLSPWAYGGANPSFGGKIYKSVLIDFIEDRPYVDYITDFQLLHSYIDFSVSPSKKVSSKDLDEVEGSTAISIIVSVPESKHSITVLTPAAEGSAREKCPCES